MENKIILKNPMAALKKEGLQLIRRQSISIFSISFLFFAASA